jgi:hypothetical protein
VQLSSRPSATIQQPRKRLSLLSGPFKRATARPGSSKDHRRPRERKSRRVIPMNIQRIPTQGILYRYTQDDDCDKAQLVVPEQERANILRAYHDAPTAGQYGIKHTLQNIRRKYYWPGMKNTGSQHIRKCAPCQRYNPTNQKPAGLLQTPALQQRFEVLAIDLFRPLPPGPQEERWIFIIEDYATRWVELFALIDATVENCAWVLVNEVFLRYGLPRCLISDNGTQFISNVMQQITFCLNIDHKFTPVYHPSANPVERRNRDIKTQLAILLGNDHGQWPTKLPAVRFAVKSTQCQGTGYTPAYLLVMFARELRSPMDVTGDLRKVVINDNFIPEVTPKLLQMIDIMMEVRDTHEHEQDQRKVYADSKQRPGISFSPGDKVWVATHPLSQAK